MSPDEEANAILATGGLYMALSLVDGVVDVEQVTNADGGVVPAIDVRFSFLKSVYRVTVTRLPGTET